jgi:hypothetical protein
MSNSLKIWLLILALVLVSVNAWFFIYSSNFLDGLTTQLEDEELSPEELARVTETASTSDSPGADKREDRKGEENVSQKSAEMPVGAEKEGAKSKDTEKLALKMQENELGAKEVARRDEKDNKDSEGVEAAESGVIKTKYRPKLIGQCKSLYEKYLRKGDLTGNHRAFTYSYDGNSGNCAIVEEQKSKQIAEKEALKACEKSKTDAANYAPCFVMASF